MVEAHIEAAAHVHRQRIVVNRSDTALAVVSFLRK
jgi:hypothetical protein